MKSIPALIIISVLLTSCYKETVIIAGEGLEDWTSATHSSSATTNYDMVFPQTKVNRFDITITKADWEIMQDNLNDMYGSSTS